MIYLIYQLLKDNNFEDNKGKKYVNNFIKWIFRQQKQIKRVIKEHFNKKLIMTTQDEEVYNNSQICWLVMKS